MYIFLRLNIILLINEPHEVFFISFIIQASIHSIFICEIINSKEPNEANLDYLCDPEQRTVSVKIYTQLEDNFADNEQQTIFIRK